MAVLPWTSGLRKYPEGDEYKNAKSLLQQRHPTPSKPFVHSRPSQHLHHLLLNRVIGTTLL